MTNCELVLCVDVDGTVIPNGRAPESAAARPRLRRLAARAETTVVYATGRHQQALEAALREYDLPRPTYAITDVGTTIYEVANNTWTRWSAWSEMIAPAWRGYDGEALADLLADLDGLRLQEPEKQNDFKLSYYGPAEPRPVPLLNEIRERLTQRDIQAHVVWSTEADARRGLLDVLPATADKRRAIEFLMREKGFRPDRTVFAGDSGNDLDVLASGLQAVLVRNASAAVRREARERVAATDHPERLYLAQGGFMGMNGNYAAGVLEGVAHFLPETVAWLDPPPAGS